MHMMSVRIDFGVMDHRTTAGQKWGQSWLRASTQSWLRKWDPESPTCMLVRCDEAGFGRAIEVKVECARPT